MVFTLEIHLLIWHGYIWNLLLLLNMAYELDKDIKKYFISLNFYIRFMHECFVYEQSDILRDYLEKNKLLKGYE